MMPFGEMLEIPGAATATEDAKDSGLSSSGLFRPDPSHGEQLVDVVGNGGKTSSHRLVAV